MEFTYVAYKSLIDELKNKNYKFVGYKEYKDYKKVVILRHDIDLDIEKAVEMAEFEAKVCNVFSTYFVLLTSNFYNVFSERSKRGLYRIKELGHDIGLHFDELRYPQDSNIVDNIEKEIKVLEYVLNDKVISVSMHRPSKKTLEADYFISNGKIANSYGTEFFGGFKYVSDSRRSWREDINVIVNSDQYERLHILTHPIWYNSKEKTLKDTLIDFFRNDAVQKYDNLNANFTDLGSVLPPSMIANIFGDNLI